MTGLHCKDTAILRLSVYQNIEILRKFDVETIYKFAPIFKFATAYESMRFAPNGNKNAPKRPRYSSNRCRILGR
jgi:hypothetical protein